MIDDKFWEEIYRDIPIALQPDEKTIPMMIEESGRECDYKTMSRQVKLWIREGKLVFVGMRMYNGNYAKAYKKA
jgi:hypothetical protein